jgi:hypothetical protein
MSILTRRSSIYCLVTVLGFLAVLTGCGIKETGKALAALPPPLLLFPSVQPTVLPTVKPPVLQTGLSTVKPTTQPTPTRSVLGPLYDSTRDLRAGPIDVPLELQIPSLKVNAPVLGVGLTSANVMDAPKGPIGDPVWHMAFWYRGSGIPGEVGTATIAGHVDNLLGEPEIFAYLQHLHPGDVIIVHLKNTTIDLRFLVDQIKVYSIKEASDPAVLTRIYGAGPVAGIGPQPALDGLSHLTLITCAGYIVNGLFDHHTVVYATLSK